MREREAGQSKTDLLTGGKCGRQNVSLRILAASRWEVIPKEASKFKYSRTGPTQGMP